MLGALSLVGPAGVWLLGFLLLPISVVSCCRVLLVVSSVVGLFFGFSEMWCW